MTDIESLMAKITKRIDDACETYIKAPDFALPVSKEECEMMVLAALTDGATIGIEVFNELHAEKKKKGAPLFGSN